MPSSKIRTILLRSIVELGIFSAVINLLVLVLPLYLLQVYDRVLPSSSYSTLVYMTIFAAGALLVLGVLETVRAHYANRVAARLEVKLGSPLFLAAMNGPSAALGDVQPLRDLAVVKGLLSSRTVFFLFDLPFAPLFILVLYLIHPLLFWTTAVGAAVLLAVALANQFATARSGKAAGEAMLSTMNAAQAFARNFETVRALGMVGNVTQKWGSRYAASLGQSETVARRNALFGGLSRTIRMVLQIAIPGFAAYLVLNGQMTAGMIFAASIISGRALQPLDQIVGGWRQIADARRAWQRVKAHAARAGQPEDAPLELPEPAGHLSVEQLIYYVPGAEDGAQPLIKRISFTAAAGETVAIIGPTQAGKSTLARLIVGVVEPRSGVVRIDGADIRTWPPDRLGRHIGYLSQEVELFPGTIAENISRLDPHASDEEILKAAELAHVHQLVLGQRKGYGTEIGPSGVRLSGGERQRIGLARAFYGDPKLIVLDEPNANLDADGEQALERALLGARARKRTVLIVTHRPSIAMKCDRVLMLRDGAIEYYGPPKQLLEKLAHVPRAPGAAPDAAAAQPPSGGTNPAASRMGEAGR